MIENCLSRKIIRDFLKNHSENKWKDLIPILIEIGILYLQKTFDKMNLTNEELKKVSHKLQHEQIEKDKERGKEINKEINIYDSLNIENEKEEKTIILKNKINQGDNNLNNNNENNQKKQLINSNKNNQEKQEKLRTSNEAIKEMKNNIKNNYQNFKNNISTDFKNKLTRRKQNNFKKINVNNNYKKEEKKKEKISYVISYDKNLRPSSISKKINNTTSNNTNIKTDYSTNPNNLFYNSIHNYSSEKIIKNYSKSKSKNKNKEKYLNLNLNNINKLENIKSNEIKHNNISQQILKNNIIRIGGNENPNYFKKLNNIIKKINLLNNETNHNNNYHVIKLDRNVNKILTNKKINNSNNYGHINNYLKNNHFVSTLYQGLNSNEEHLKSMNNYFSNRDELENFIRKNKVDKNKIYDRKDCNNSKSKKNIIKSEKPIDRKNSFLKLDDNETYSNNFGYKKDLSKNKNKSTQSFKKRDETKDKESYNLLLKSFPSKKEMSKLKEEITPKKIYIKTEKDTISSFKNDNLKEVNDKEINKEIKTIKLFDIKSAESKEKMGNVENKENNLFLKNISKNRYFNMFNHEGEVDFSLTQMEKDCSGIFDSSISNENQINPDYFFKETPKNIFKNDKSNEQSMNSNDNKAN